MSIFKDKMSDKTRRLYDFMWGEKTELAEHIEKATQKDGCETTYRFKGDVGKEGELLTQRFGLDASQFGPMFKKVCSGDGNEKEKITILHSSSLCALLFFYNVSKENPVTISIDEEEVTFDWVTFEFKNPVIKNPSNMDIVLVSKDKKYVLFLESKFSEYYMYEALKSGKISNAYREEGTYSWPLYQKDILGDMGIWTEDVNEENKFVLKAGEKVYLDGIKQMISHYVGVNRRVDRDIIFDDKKNPDAQVILDVIAADAKLCLGEVIFDFENAGGIEKENEKEYFKKIADRYRRKYEELAKNMNKFSVGKVTILPKSINYSEIKTNHEVAESVLEFYNF